MLKKTLPFTILVLILLPPGLMNCNSNNDEENLKRVGMVIKLKPEYLEEYRRIHTGDACTVRDLLTGANIRNFSIFLIQLEDGNYYEFGYYEYTGKDLDADMEKLAANQRYIEWLKVTDNMQIPLKGHKGWAEMEQIYYNR